MLNAILGCKPSRVGRFAPEVFANEILKNNKKKLFFQIYFLTFVITEIAQSAAVNLLKVECKWKTPAPNGTYGMVCKLDSFLLDQIYNMNDSDVPFDEFKPYLFPLSSMTEEQRKEYDSIIYHNIELHCERYYDVIDVDCYEELHDFYHKNHLDYRNLIGMGIALDATGLNIYN